MDCREIGLYKISDDEWVIFLNDLTTKERAEMHRGSFDEAVALLRGCGIDEDDIKRLVETAGVWHGISSRSEGFGLETASPVTVD